MSSKRMEDKFCLKKGELKSELQRVWYKEGPLRQTGNACGMNLIPLSKEVLEEFKSFNKGIT